MKNLHVFLFSLILVLTACHPKTASKVTQTAPKAPTPVEQPTVPKVEIPDEPPIAVEEPVEEEKVELIASIKKTACYGTCPTFETKIYSDGRVTYYGKKNVERVGHYEGMLKGDFQAEIRDMAVSVKYFNLSKTYPSSGRNIVDLPNTITYYKLNEKEQQIVNNHDAPNALKEFESFLLNLTEKVEWTKISGQ